MSSSQSVAITGTLSAASRRSRRNSGLLTIDLDLLPDRIESPESPQIRGLDVVVGVRVKALVGLHKLIELMNDQKDRGELNCVGHERIERSVRVIYAKA
jgi:hypothetical protein